MKRYIDADLLRKEIESRMGDCDANSKNPNQLLWAELAALLPFIDSLQQEQQELPKIEIAEYYYHKGVYEGLSQGRADALKILDEFAKIKADSVIVIKQQEQPCDTCTNDKGCVTCKDGELWEGKSEVDLEKEIKTWIPAHIVGGDEAPWKELKDVVIQWAGIVARHFYILGLKNNIPVTQITLDELAKEGEPVSEGLEVAAIDFADKARKELYFKDYAVCSIADYDHGCIDGFKAGAEWQKEQMMKDAVERTVKIDSGGYPYIDITAELYDYEHDVPLAKEGDLVKIIIVKEDKK